MLLLWVAIKLKQVHLRSCVNKVLAHFSIHKVHHNFNSERMFISIHHEIMPLAPTWTCHPGVGPVSNKSKAQYLGISQMGEMRSSRELFLRRAASHLALKER